MFIQLNLDTNNVDDRRALVALVATLSATQPAPRKTSDEPPTKMVVVTDQGAFDVPPVPIDVAIEEARAEPAEVVTFPPTTPKAVSVADATAAIQAAQSRGIGIDKVKELLAKFDVKRVTELTDDKRAEFVAALVSA